MFSPRAFNDDKIKAKKKVENSSGWKKKVKKIKGEGETLIPLGNSQKDLATEFYKLGMADPGNLYKGIEIIREKNFAID